MSASFGVLDLFAGPGGLGEGFAGLAEDGRYPFRIGLSVEKERSAHLTLRLRAFLREMIRENGRLPREYVEFHAGHRPEPDWEQVSASAWKLACSEARCLELGSADAASEIDRAIKRVKVSHADTILIGGPPCQAYSLVGRARSRGTVGYRPEADERHFLFREYIRVLERLRPAAFVMENVKGVLSSTVESGRIFEMIMEDLASVGGSNTALYELRALAVEDGRIRLREIRRHSDFIVRAEQFGVPQRRHRVIIVGIRSDLAARAEEVSVNLPRIVSASVHDAIGDLEPLRSGLSRGEDTAGRWADLVSAAAGRLRRLHPDDREMADAFGDIASGKETMAGRSRQASSLPTKYGLSSHPLKRWLENDELLALAQHSTRGHMASDLDRYLFAAVFGSIKGVSPKASDYPDPLAPRHRNWQMGVFSDRFRVQLSGGPATTVTSHISKDGHYFIHPDPAQCRSLTVKEAARLQTFPDDYYFLGNRTQQYVQVGNAVPPYLARQIAQLLLRVLDGSGTGDFSADANVLEPALA